MARIVHCLILLQVLVCINGFSIGKLINSIFNTTTPSPRPSGTGGSVSRPSSSSSSGGARCGVPIGQGGRGKVRIVGGKESQPNSWPWQVLLQMRETFLCGGSLVDRTHVLTAAHCFQMSTTPSAYRVVVGLHDRTQGDGTIVRVSNIAVHPKYSKTTNVFDVAVLTLAKPVTFSNTISPVCLPHGDIPPGSKCMATGWGKTHSKGKTSESLREAEVEIMPTSTCNDRAHYGGRIKSTMFCAGAPGKDSCQGDSGGPLACKRPDGDFEQIGITSWGAGCADETKPGVYTNVTAVRSWIEEQMSS